MFSLGIDSGSTMTKGVLFDGRNVVGCHMLPTSMRPGEILRDIYSRLYTEETGFVVSTGYGRELLKEADAKITEITCHGAGASYLAPGCDTVIDIGGQDCKVITLDSHGQVNDFLMNDKCAAGTGRFMEMIMARVGSDISHLDDFVQGCRPVPINSMCAVFAESEIVGLMAQETPPGDIVLGCVHSICHRTAIFAQRLTGGHPHIFFSGGLAQSEIMRSVLGEYMNTSHITTHPLSQYTGAIGAAVLGYGKLKKRSRS